MDAFRRIVTHTDFDGLISAVLLRDILNVEPIAFAEPWLIQNREYEILKGDVIVDLPYDERCALWIDHHSSNAEVAEELRRTEPEKVIFDTTDSCPRLIYNRFHAEHPSLDEPDIQEKIRAADKIDMAQFTKEDIDNPDDYGKLSISLKTDDPRKDEEYRRLLINLLSFMPITKILQQPIVQDRVERKMREHERWKEELPRFVTELRDKKIVVVDFTQFAEDTSGVPRFLVYALYPWAKIAVTIYPVKNDPESVKMSAGKNIFAEKSGVDIGAVCKRYGGGGHADAAGCSVPRVEKAAYLQRFIGELTEN